MREALPIAMNKSVTWKIKILNQHTLKKKKRMNFESLVEQGRK